ncbi:50S ribosomal protein L35 [Clostridia bacterium]|nr:50S ribosomal protein L35 [Clostridia bacterium]GHU76695.1 50S ribosomal protein L35 [Clostridia bacterium]
MPKLKTNKSAAKRFKITGTGKFKYSKCNKQHILGKKSPKRKRKLRRPDIVSHSSESKIRELLPYA